jgi:predicted secreted protein
MSDRRDESTRGHLQELPAKMESQRIILITTKSSEIIVNQHTLV